MDIYAWNLKTTAKEEREGAMEEERQKKKEGHK
jgi:hypothetical protein